jgi:hypothetical protein
MTRNISPSSSAEWLTSHHGTLFARISQYAPERYNLLINQARAPLAGPLENIPLCDSEWLVSLETRNIPGDGDAIACEVTFECTTGGISAASVSVDLEITDWAVENYVLLPAAAYNGNRFLSRRIPYSPKLWFVDDIGPDKPTIVTDIPKLNDGDGPSRIQERSGSMAFPSIGFRSARSGRGIWMLTDQGNSLGDYGIDIEENRDRSKATLSITAPVVRELYSYRNCDMRAPSVDVPMDFKAGDVVKISFRLHAFAARDVQAVFDKFAALRKPSPVSPAPNLMPFSACFALQEAKFNRDNFVPEHGYYSVGPRQNFLQDWQIGWTGGMISTYPLLFAGDATTRENVIRNFDWLFPNGISPSGFFWDCGANGTEWLGGDIRKPHTVNWHLIRKSADAVFFIVKQFMLMEQLGIEVKPAWHDGTRGVCEAFVKLWRENAQFGQFVDSLTGAVRVGGSTSAALAPAALALASQYFNEPSYQEVAEQSAELFYQKYTRAGLSTGGPGDALQNPDSESWFALIESYVALHDATGDAKWLARAAETSRQFSTWVVSYDFEFPAESMFGKADIRTAGSVYANTQNKHSAPGLCTLSGLGLLKLFRATGDRFHLDLLRDIAHGLPQYLPHPLKPVGNVKDGWMCERVNMTDWEGPERLGETLRMTTWAETSLMLTTIEIPGLYVRPDQSLVVAFDHIEAEIVSDDKDRLVVKLTNPTPMPANVRILSENASDAHQALPENALRECQIADLKPGESTTLDFPKSSI